MFTWNWTWLWIWKNVLKPELQGFKMERIDLKPARKEPPIFQKKSEQELKVLDMKKTNNIS